MKLLFVVAHPKHIFIFKNVIEHFESKNIPCKVLAVDKDIVIDLLNTFGFDYDLIGKNNKGLVNNIIEMPKRLFKGILKTKKFSPTIILGQADPFFAVIGKILAVPTIFLPDTEGSFSSRYVAFPLASIIMVPRSYNIKIEQEHIRLNHYLELAYLHPYYASSSIDVYNLLKIKPEEKFVIMRFVSRNSHHDIGNNGISDLQKKHAVDVFLEYAKVFISAENELPTNLEQYRIKINPEDIHQVMEKASLFFGESATMATESAVLGTPAIFIDNAGRGYTHDIEKNYGLIFNFKESVKDQEKAIEKGLNILKNNSKEKLKKNKDLLIKEKLDITSYLINFIKEYHN